MEEMPRRGSRVYQLFPESPALTDSESGSFSEEMNYHRERLPSIVLEPTEQGEGEGEEESPCEGGENTQEGDGSGDQETGERQEETEGETSICHVRATVMTYDEANKRWVTVGSETAILSRVQIYHNTEANTFRVVGRKLQADQEVVINCAITKGMKYNLASANFFQLRDSRQLWGLNFGSKDDGPLFSDSIKYALETLANGNNTGPVQGSQGVRPVASPQSAPAAPPTPPAPPAPPPPPPKEVAASSAGAPPPPPGPPPPPAPAPPSAPPPPGAAPAGHSGSEGGGGGGGMGGDDLAAALAGAKLRKAPKKEEDASSPSKEAPASGGGGSGGGGGLMGEMSAILARRRKVSDVPAVKKDETRNEGSDSLQSKPSKQNDTFVKPQGRSTTLPRPKPSTLIQREPSFSTTSPVSPFSPARMKNMKTNPESPTTEYTDLKQLKEDILLEVKKELHKVKEEIITALIEHLQGSEV
ncbi:unnamed protein product [Lota lota]